MQSQQEMMSITEILQALEYFSSELPREALEAARQQKDALTPVLLGKFEEWKESYYELADDYYLHIYTLFLLAEFREKRAYPLIIDLMIGVDKETYDLFGDVITEFLPSLLASVYDGDLEPLLRLIDTANDEYVQGSGIQALVILYMDGQLSREELINHLEKIGRGYLDFQDKINSKVEYLASKLISECLDIHGTELKGLINALYNKQIVDTTYVNRKDVKQAFTKKTLETALDELRENSYYQLVDTTVGIMEKWYCFLPEEKQKQQNEIIQTALTGLLGDTYFFLSRRKKSGGGFNVISGMEGENGDRRRQKKVKPQQQKASRRKNRHKNK